MKQMQQLFNDIRELEGFITKNTLERVIQEFSQELQLRPMTITGDSANVIRFNILVYKGMLNIGIICFDEDNKIYHTEYNLNGIDFNKYASGSIFKPMKEYKEFATFSEETGLDYNNKFTVNEKLEMLTDYIKENVKPIKQIKKSTNPDDKRKLFKITPSMRKHHNEFCLSIEHLHFTEQKTLWEEYIKVNKKTYIKVADRLPHQDKGYDWIKKDKDNK